jgi:hypothetical protein
MDYLLDQGRSLESLSEKIWSGRRDRTHTARMKAKITAPLFSQLTKRLRKNQCACNADLHAVPDLRIAGGGLGDGFVALDCRSKSLA